MVHRNIVLSVTVVAMLTLSAGVAWAGGVTSEINYQGQLTDSAGNPLSGAYSMTFQLYGVSSGGTALDTDTHNVVVTDGLFNTEIDFDQSYFDGRALWLGVKVDADDEMTPRQEFGPVPYALSLVPGARIMGAAQWNLNVETTHASGRALRGQASSTSGTNYGVVGVSKSPSGYGGYFYNNGGGVGVYGRGEYGGYFDGNVYVSDNVGIGIPDLGRGILLEARPHHLEVRGGDAGSWGLLVEANNRDDGTGAMMEFNGGNLCGIVNIFGGTTRDENIPKRNAMIKLHPADSDGNHTSAQHKKVALLADGHDGDKFKIITGINDSANPKNPGDIFWKAGGVTAMTITKDGDVGIGTDPEVELHVKGRVEADKGTFGRISSFYAKADSEPGITFHNTGADYCDWVIFAGGGGGGSYNHDLTIMRTKLPGGYPTNPAGSVIFLGEYLTTEENQWEPIKVGINEHNPTHALDVIGDVHIRGDLIVTGNKYFVQAHPTDPTKEIGYVSLEGPEAGTYIRGTAQIVNGEAVINLPEHFSLVTIEEGLTVQLTPIGEWLQLYVVKKGTQQVIIHEAKGKNGQFDYIVQGVRKGHENHQVIRAKE